MQIVGKMKNKKPMCIKNALKTLTVFTWAKSFAQEMFMSNNDVGNKKCIFMLH